MSDNLSIKEFKVEADTQTSQGCYSVSSDILLSAPGYDIRQLIDEDYT